MTSLTIAIITHAPEMPVLAQVLERLDRALAHARQRQLLEDVYKRQALWPSCWVVTLKW